MQRPSPARRITMALLGVIIVEGHHVAASANIVGFDHQEHEVSLRKAHARGSSCSDCHKQRGGLLIGRPDHKSCFSNCHKPVAATRKPLKRSRSRRRVCTSCHTVIPGEVGNSRVPYPPYVVHPDYRIVFSHSAHSPAKPSGTQCGTCHNPSSSDKRNIPHARCIGCHRTPKAPAIPTMQQCGACHVARNTGPTRPYLSPSTSTIEFSHSAHSARDAHGCVDCHAPITRAADLALPRPRSADCEPCHNGKRAFSTLSEHCTRCHKPPDKLRPVMRTPVVGFNHRTHATAKLTCTSCHDSKAALPTMKHAACSSAGCHRAEFSAQRPRICATCHVGTEPWRPLHRDSMPGRRSQFSSVFSHRQHASTIRSASCALCHNMDDASRPRLAGHTTCSSAACHGSGRIKPNDLACADCHRLQPTQAPDRKPWSVRSRFSHQLHQHAVKGKPPLPCSRCHARTTASTWLLSPSKAACVPCHDGAAAFKMTGHGCIRCHGP